MKKLLVLAFVVSSVVACSKNKPATTTKPPDAKMEGAAPKTDETKSETKPTEGATDTPAADPCAPPH